MGAAGYDLFDASLFPIVPKMFEVIDELVEEYKNDPTGMSTYFQDDPKLHYIPGVGIAGVSANIERHAFSAGTVGINTGYSPEAAEAIPKVFTAEFIDALLGTDGTSYVTAPDYKLIAEGSFADYPQGLTSALSLAPFTIGSPNSSRQEESRTRVRKVASLSRR